MSAIPSFDAFDAQVDGHRLRVLSNGADRLKALIETIEAAKASLRLFYYIFADDDCGKRVKAALIEARGRGVKVSVLIDRAPLLASVPLLLSSDSVSVNVFAPVPVVMI